MPPLQAKELLKELGLRAKKGLGQHFLVNEGVLRQIVDAAELTREDMVLEVGPGLGILTREIARRAARIIAFELDEELVPALQHTLRSSPNVTILKADILKVDIADVFQEHAREYLSGYKVIANLPYYITAPVLRRFLEAIPPPLLMVVMVQREVGERIVAQPGAMSLLSVAVQVYGRPRIVGSVPARSFYPPPKVASVILRIEPHRRHQPVEATHDFFTVVRAGFSAPRKQLRNALALGLNISPNLSTALLEGAGIAPERRAATLSLVEWDRLRTAVRKERKNVLAQS